MDLTTWSEEHYIARGWMSTKIYFGARRLRCDYCRVNFAGFRPPKMKYRRAKPINSPPEPVTE